MALLSACKKGIEEPAVGDRFGYYAIDTNRFNFTMAGASLFNGGYQLFGKQAPGDTLQQYLTVFFPQRPADGVYSIVNHVGYQPGLGKASMQLIRYPQGGSPVTYNSNEGGQINVSHNGDKLFATWGSSSLTKLSTGSPGSTKIFKVSGIVREP